MQTETRVFPSWLGDLHLIRSGAGSQVDPGRVVAVDAQTGWQRLRAVTAAGAQTEEWVDPTRVVHVDPRTGWQKVRTVRLAASAFQAAGAAATGGAAGAPGAPGAGWGQLQAGVGALSTTNYLQQQAAATAAANLAAAPPVRRNLSEDSPQLSC